MSPAAGITVTGLTKRYGRKVAVDDLSFAVRPGVVTGFLGPNGAGKTTTMRLFIDLDRPSAGRVLINGHRYGQLRHPLRIVGSMLESQRIHPNRSAYNHLKWLALSNRIPLARVDEVLGIVGLESVAGKKVKTFSLGMSQRLGIGAALLGDPEILLLDEPINGLDPEGIFWARQLMRSLAAEGRAVLVSSHVLSEAELTADSVVIIGRGKLLVDSPVADFVAGHGTAPVLVGSPRLGDLAAALAAGGLQAETVAGGETLRVRGASAADIGDLAYQAGVPVHELTTERVSLEQAFLAKTLGQTEFHTTALRPEDS